MASTISDKDEVILALEKENAALKKDNEKLRKENEKLNKHFEWRVVEALVAEMTEGELGK